MKYLTLLALLLATPVLAQEIPDNSAIYHCRDKHEYKGLHLTNTKSWMDIATCISTIKNQERRQKQAEQWAFVKANPRYRFPGMSWNDCFGHAEEIAIKKIEHTKNNMIVYYKDKINPCVRGNQ